MNSETVKPMPATNPMPERTASQAARVMPATLPTTRPSTTPAVTRSVPGASNEPASITTPALASAKRGTTRKLVHGWRRCSRRSAGETDVRANRVMASSSAGVGSSPRSATHSLATAPGPALALA